VQACVLDLGENYYPEARDKIPLFGPEIRWHFTGHLQSNKAKYVVGAFTLIHSLDSLPLAQEIGRRASARNRVQSVLIEVKLDPSDTKRGVALEETLALAEQVTGICGVRLCGLMGMAPYAVEPEEARSFFARLRRLFEELPVENRQILSMGMSGDFEVGVEEGATHVRIGTAIFGLRS
jgi:pyridoxal phosphate enzyme (YggS family)